MKKRIRAVIDTNVVVSGILTDKGYPFLIINAWISGKLFQPIISKRLQEEINEVLARPKIKNRLKKNSKEIKTVLGILFNKAEKIKPATIKEFLFTDNKDHFLLELAVSGKVSYIVSGDLGITENKRYKNIEFLTPAEFCNKIGIDSIS